MPVQLISVQEAARRLDAGSPPQLIDVRTPSEHQTIHVVGARSVPLDQLDAADVLRRRTEDGSPVYLICQGGGRSAKAGAVLEAAGIAPVYSIDGGMAAWERAGLPVQRGGGRVISLERQVRIAAGSLVLLSLGLAWTVHRAFLGLAVFVGAGLIFAGVTDFCGMGTLLAHMPWNRRSAAPPGNATPPTR